MTQQLIKYEAACRALAACKSVDEVKSWSDKAAAMQAYGRMAKDKTLEVDAAEIRIRAERRLGELIAAQKAGPGLAKPGVKPAGNSVVSNDRIQVPKLSDSGISKDLSSRAQKLAAVPEAEFEAELAAKRERDQAEGARVSAKLQAAGEREMKKKGAEAESVNPEALAEAKEAISILSEENDRLTDRLAVEAMDASEEEKRQAAETISELRAKVKTLEAELAAVKVSRDTYMRENLQLKKQVAMQRKQLDKVAA